MTTCYDFPSDAMLWIKEVEMVDSLEELKSSLSVCGGNFPQFRDVRCEDCVCSEQDHPDFPVQEEGQSRGAESPERGLVSTRRQIAFMIYDYFRVTGAHETVLEIADLFSVTLHDDKTQEFDTSWMKFYYVCQRYHRLMSWKVCTN